MIPEIHINEFDYDLPDGRIATHPLPQRDESKLLIYKDGSITTVQFKHLSQHLPADTMLVFNETRVVEARLLFKKETGALIEVFCLEPHEKYPDVSTAMQQTGSIWYKCLIGGASKWKHGMLLTKAVKDYELTGSIVARNKDSFVIELSWTNPNLTFAEVLHDAGEIPLPPYLHRQVEKQDKERYQTVYAKEEGSVAAPTAGLHFTDELLSTLQQHGVLVDYVTLHVGAGTFMPVKVENLKDHVMHKEFIDVKKEFIQTLINNLHRKIVAVGTTSLRTIETLYWLGIFLKQNPGAIPTSLDLNQWTPYETSTAPDVKTSLEWLLSWMTQHNLSRVVCRTQLIIIPGYQFKIANGIITNFHQPRSTLLLLVSAMVDGDWKSIYDYALNNNFRFLSYGDSSLLWRRNP